MALDMRPGHIEGEGFKELLHTLEPGYTVPTRATVMEVGHTKYLSTWSEMYKAIQDCEAVSFTTDIWTLLQMEAYLTITSHFTFYNRFYLFGQAYYISKNIYDILHCQAVALSLI